MNDITPLVEAYIRSFNEILKRESYKWKAVRHFQNVFSNSILPLAETLREALKHADNLLASNNYYPAKMMELFAMEKPEETLKALNILFDENVLLIPRVNDFLQQIEYVFKSMKNEGFRDWKDRINVQSFQDTHSASVYLTLKDPSKNYIYKWTVFSTAAEKVGYTINAKDKVDKLLEFYSFCDEIKKELLKQKGFIEQYEEILNSLNYVDPQYNLLTQDFVYAIARYLNADTYRKKDKKKPLALHVKSLASKDFFTEEPTIEGHFRGKKGINYIERDEQNRNLGILGEIWAVNFERERLLDKGISFDVRHASLLDGDGLGYDILSVEDDGITPRYIEVKTTMGGAYQPFFFSINEQNRSIQNSSNYYLYRVCNFKSAVSQADVIIIQGALTELQATPVTFKAELKLMN